jgi:hypothetical protein
MANLNLATYSEYYFEIRKDNAIVRFNQQSMIKKNNCFKMTSCGTYSKQTSYGNSWEMFKVVPINEKGEEFKLKLKGQFFLIGFFHSPNSLIEFDFGIGKLQSKLKAKNIEDFLEGRSNGLSQDLAEKLNRFKSFFNKNLNPDKLLLDKKIELVEKHLFNGTKRGRLKIEAGKKGEIILRY